MSVGAFAADDGRCVVLREKFTGRVLVEEGEKAVTKFCVGVSVLV